MLRNFKEQVITELEEIDPRIVAAQADLVELLERIFAGEFGLRRAQPIEAVQCKVRGVDICQQFANLVEVGIPNTSRRSGFISMNPEIALPHRVWSNLEK